MGIDWSTQDMIVGIIASQITQATTWTYLGTSGTQNGSVTKPAVYGSCATSGDVGTWLASNYPASNYAMGYIMRVQHTYYDDEFQTFSCSDLYYRAD
jgi:hypothetical protein